MRASIQDQLRETVRRPKCGEVWKVRDKRIVLHEENRQDKYKRPVLIISSDKILDSHSIVNVIPLSRSGQVTNLTFPIHRAYSNCFNGFKPHQSSKAVIPFYQPIEEQFLEERVGEIELNSVNAIKRILCYEIIEFVDFDLDP